MLWCDRANEVYSERTDLSEATFKLLVELTLKRRAIVIKDNALELYERDQVTLQEAIDREATQQVP
jgi:hypothetical protein